MTSRLPWRAVTVGVAAILAYAWTFELHFQFDDHWLILAAPEQLRRVAQPFTDHGPLPALLEHLFQPVCWLWLELDRALSGEPLQASVYHATSVVVHAGTALAMYVLMRRHVSSNAALAAGLVLAAWPAGAQAVSWSAARGDMLWVTFTLLACLVVRRSVWMAGIFVALGFASKSSAWLSLPVLVGYCLLVDRREPRQTAIDLVILALPLALTAFVRAQYLGTWSMLYLGGISAQSTQIGNVLDALPSTLDYLVAPRNEAPTELAPLLPSIVSYTAWGLVVICLVQRRLARACVGILAVAIPLLPAAFLWHFYPNAPGIYSSRALYPVVAGLAVLVAMAFDGREENAPPRSWGEPILASVALFVAAISGMLHVAKLETGAATQTRARVASLVDAAAEVGDDVTFVVKDSEPTFHGVLMTHTQIAAALRPPFVAQAVPVVWAEDFAKFVESGSLARIEGRVQLRALRDSGRFVAESEVLPALPEPLPVLERVGDKTWRPAAPVAPRACSSLVVVNPRSTATDIGILILADGKRFPHRARLVDGRAVVSLQTDLALATRKQIDSIEIEATDAVVAGCRLELLRALPRFRVVAPSKDTRMRLTNTPEFVLEDFPPSAGLRLELQLVLFGAKLPFTYVAPAEALRTRENRLVYSPRLDDFQGENGLPWPDTMQKIARELALPNGVRTLGISGVAFAVRGATKLARSDPFEWTVDCEDGR